LFEASPGLLAIDSVGGGIGVDGFIAQGEGLGEALLGRHAAQPITVLLAQAF
jgi:hypothetical protein